MSVEYYDKSENMNLVFGNVEIFPGRLLMHEDELRTISYSFYVISDILVS